MRFGCGLTPPPLPLPSPYLGNAIISLQANAPEFFQLDLQADLASQLQGRTIIEHPVFIVALPGEETELPLAQQAAQAAAPMQMPPPPPPAAAPPQAQPTC